MLTKKSFSEGLAVLAKRDAGLAAVLDRYGPPPMWNRQVGFPTLVHIILEQQVSLASAKAAFDRLEATLSGITPEGLLGLSDAELKTIGFSRQKTRYCRELSRAIVDGRFDLKGLTRLSDSEARDLASWGSGPCQSYPAGQESRQPSRPGPTRTIGRVVATLAGSGGKSPLAPLPVELKRRDHADRESKPR